MKRFAAALVVLLLASLPAAAQDATASNSSGSKSELDRPKQERKADAPLLDAAAQEAAALAFAEANFPELARLVASLKKQQPKEFQKAVRDLYRTADRLAKVRRQDDVRYDLELKTWKCQTQIELLMAQHKLRPADKDRLRAELRQALLERLRLRLVAMEQERAKLTERLAKLDKQIEQMDREQEALVDRLLAKLAPIEKEEAKKGQGGRRQPAERPEDKTGPGLNNPPHPKHTPKPPR